MRSVSVIATLAVLLLLLVMVPAHPTGAQKTVTVDNFTVYVSQDGINGTAGNFTLGPVTQGDTVIIAFIWNDSDVPYNAHQMEIDGYNLTTDVLNEQSPKSVVQFTADMMGTFRIYCVIPCLGMDNMQNGWLVVKSVSQSTTGSTTSSAATSIASNSTTSIVTANATISTTSTAAISSTVTTATSTSTARTSTATTRSTNSTTSSGLTSTRLSVLSMNVQDGKLLASVGLSDSNGTPIAGVKVQFSIPTDFGKMSIGSSLTKPNGTAYLVYQLPSQWGGFLYASYSGSKSYASSNVTAAIEYDPASDAAGSPYVSGQGNFVDLRLVGIPPVPAEVVMGIFILVLGSVYAVILFALIHVLGITRRRDPRVDK